MHGTDHTQSPCSATSVSRIEFPEITAEFVGALTAQGIAPHVVAATQHSAAPEHIKPTEGYRFSLRRRKIIEEAFGWVKEIGTLRRLMARGLDKIRAHALLNLAACNLTQLGNLLTP